MNSAEIVVRIGKLHTQVQEASAKGFKTDEAMRLLYALEGAVDSLMTVATAEYLARGSHAAREVAANSSVARRFRNKDGFSDDTAYVQIQPNGDTYLVKNNGFSEKSRAYDLERCLAFVSGGDWIELEVA